MEKEGRALSAWGRNQSHVYAGAQPLEHVGSFCSALSLRTLYSGSCSPLESCTLQSDLTHWPCSSLSLTALLRFQNIYYVSVVYLVLGLQTIFPRISGNRDSHFVKVLQLLEHRHNILNPPSPQRNVVVATPGCECAFVQQEQQTWSEMMYAAECRTILEEIQLKLGKSFPSQ